MDARRWRWLGDFAPDVVVIDQLMPEVDGISATRMIRADLPNTEVVVMTGLDEDASAVESIRAGAIAYLLKDTRVEVLLRAIRGAGAGQVAMPAQAAARLVRVVGRQEALSERESEVLRLVALGMANKQIARELGIAQSTVKSHVGSIFGKLGLLAGPRRRCTPRGLAWSRSSGSTPEPLPCSSAPERRTEASPHAVASYTAASYNAACDGSPDGLCSPRSPGSAWGHCFPVERPPRALTALL